MRACVRACRILELDRGSGIPFEGNYSEWLGAKEKRLASEAKAQAHLQKVRHGVAPRRCSARRSC